MDASSAALVAVLLFFAAALYSTVGHGGASAYLAIMALFAVAPETMRPTALALNLVVAALASWRFWRAGQTDLKLLVMFAATAVPAAFIGGGIEVPADIYRPLVGILLWIAALRLFWQPLRLAHREAKAVNIAVALPVGALLGLLAGLTGTGGGIFLSPLIILFGWADARRTSGVAAGFILLNSIAGLVGNISSVQSLPAELPLYVLVVAAGAMIGTWLGASHLAKPKLLQGLGLVLVIAGAKLIFT